MLDVKYIHFANSEITPCKIIKVLPSVKNIYAKFEIFFLQKQKKQKTRAKINAAKVNLKD